MVVNGPTSLSAVPATDTPGRCRSDRRQHGDKVAHFLTKHSYGGALARQVFAQLEPARKRSKGGRGKARCSAAGVFQIPVASSLELEIWALCSFAKWAYAATDGAPTTYEAETIMSQCPMHDFPIPRTASPLDPPREYDVLRREEPIAKVRMWDGRNAWICTRYEDVREVLTSPHFSAMPSAPGYPLLSAARKAQVNAYQTFITMDPPDHTKFRRMLAKEFMIKRMETLRPMVQKALDGIYDDMSLRHQPCDLIEAMALPLPSLAVSLLLGVPYEDAPRLQEWSAQRIDLTIAPEMAKAAHQNMFDYLDGLLTEKEKDPGDGSDLIGRLVIDQIQPGHLQHVDAVHMINLLYIAGHETTANQIGLGTLSLLTNPDQRALIERDPSLVKNAVEEMLRFHTIVQYNACRAATADVQIGGQQIKAGEGVYALLSAADRDPGVFSDPGKFDVMRENANRHMAFSFGIHTCLGHPLARLELEVVFSTLFKRFPRLELAVPAEHVEFKQGTFVHGLARLPVRW